MARKPTGKPVGPPPKEIDFANFEMMCAIWCTSEEIAAHLKVHVNTLREKVEKHYGEEYPVVYKRLYDAGAPSLRRDRRVLAKKNSTMAIYLGKKHLGEKDEDVKQDINLALLAEMMLKLVQNNQPDAPK